MPLTGSIARPSLVALRESRAGFLAARKALYPWEDS
jgi:hypothetical protein